MHDILVIGGGPAGLSAALNAGFNGLRVALLDGDSQIGGRAKQSGLVENYPGFPEGISGAELMGRMVEQANRFGVEMFCPANVVNLLHSESWWKATTDDYQEFEARAVILAVGLNHAKLSIPHVGRLMNRGIYYGMPDLHTFKKVDQAVVIGGANSAGQAVLKLASRPGMRVTMLVRRELNSTMANSLIERIKLCKNVQVFEDVEVTEVAGKSHLEYLKLSNGEIVFSNHAFLFLGAKPKTAWMKGKFILTEDGHIRSSSYHEVPAIDRSYPRGLFVAGDVRDGATNGVAPAIGEGFSAFYKAKDYLTQLKG